MATLNHEEIPPLNLDTHLTDDGILDSLDSLIFFLELEKITGVKISDAEYSDKSIYIIENILNR